MPVIPNDEYNALLKQFIEAHSDPDNRGDGANGRMAFHKIMEKRFQIATGYIPDPGPPSSARPGNFGEFVRKATGR